MLKVKLFGSGQAFYDDYPLASFPAQQPHLLLCYLLLNSRYPHLRDQLATVFWGDYTTQMSRKYLRNSLWKLRQIFEAAHVSLEDYLLISDESVAFIRSSPYWLDVEVFETAIEACRDIPGRDLTPDQGANLESAVELYAGDLLEGTYCEWTLYERERLSLIYLSTLGKLMDYYEAHGQYERGLACGERILARDNTRESVHLQLMRLYWSSGDRSSALAQYKRCAQILRQELGIAPLKETTAVYQQMAHNEYSPTSSVVMPRRVTKDHRLSTLAEKTLQRLQALQQMLEETNAELRRIESMIHKELLHPDA